MTEQLYNWPEYYDLAFSWDTSAEMDLMSALFQRYVSFPVRHILEPGCGTARILIALARRGYQVTGYDNDRKMLAYAEQRIVNEGLQDLAAAVFGDMRTAVFETKFDAALNPINTLGYLLSDEDIVAHFRNAGSSLKSGGVYIVQLTCAWDNLEPKEDEGWTMEREGIRVTTVWAIRGQDCERKLSHQVCKMQIDDHGRQIRFEEPHILRLWTFDDIVRLTDESGKLRLEAICDQKGKEVPLGTHITGERGNLYYVLKTL